MSVKIIWKFDIIPGKNIIQMPLGAEILAVKTQYNEPKLWALVDPRLSKEARCFEVYGTGHDITITPEHKYIDTFILHDGSFVFHVFELIIIK